MRKFCVLILAVAPLLAQNPVNPLPPSPQSSTQGIPDPAERTIHHSQLLTDAQVAAAIDKGMADKHGQIGLSLIDMQTAILSGMACKTCHESGYTVTIYTPEQWIEHLAAYAKSEMLPFTVADVTPDMREPLLHVLAEPSKSDYINANGLSGSSSVHRVVLTDRTKTQIVQPVSNVNGTVETNSAIRSYNYSNAVSTFQMLDVDKVRGDDNGEFFVVVVGDKQNKYFKVKTRMFKQLFGSESYGM